MGYQSVYVGPENKALTIRDIFFKLGYFRVYFGNHL